MLVPLFRNENNHLHSSWVLSSFSTTMRKHLSKVESTPLINLRAKLIHNFLTSHILLPGMWVSILLHTQQKTYWTVHGASQGVQCHQSAVFIFISGPTLTEQSLWNTVFASTTAETTVLLPSLFPSASSAGDPGTNQAREASADFPHH